MPVILPGWLRKVEKGRQLFQYELKTWKKETMWCFGQRVKYFNRPEQAVKLDRKTNKGKVTVGSEDGWKPG